MRTSGTSTHGSASSVAQVRAIGTNTSSAVKWWLPVPHSPDTVQVSSIAISDSGEHHRAQPPLPVDFLETVAEQPVAVQASAGETPPPAHPVATVDAFGHAGRREHPSDGHVGALGEDGVERRPGQPGEIAPGA